MMFIAALLAFIGFGFADEDSRQEIRFNIDQRFFLHSKVSTQCDGKIQSASKVMFQNEFAAQTALKIPDCAFANPIIPYDPVIFQFKYFGKNRSCDFDGRPTIKIKLSKTFRTLREAGKAASPSIFMYQSKLGCGAGVAPLISDYDSEENAVSAVYPGGGFADPVIDKDATLELSFFVGKALEKR